MLRHTLWKNQKKFQMTCGEMFYSLFWILWIHSGRHFPQKEKTKIPHPRFLASAHLDYLEDLLGKCFVEGWKEKENNIRRRTKTLKDTNIQKFQPSDVRHWSAGSWNNWLKLLQLNIAAIRLREVTAFTFWHWWFGYGATFLLEYMQSSFKNLCLMFILAPFDLC